VIRRVVYSLEINLSVSRVPSSLSLLNVRTRPFSKEAVNKVSDPGIHLTQVTGESTIDAFRLNMRNFDVIGQKYRISPDLNAISVFRVECEVSIEVIICLNDMDARGN
jgi:hypothetical protein